MRCPFCNTLENKVIDSRLSQGGAATRRRRECEACGRRYTTYERVDVMLPMVVKKDDTRQPFDRVKVLAGLRRASVKRPISAEDRESIVANLERELAESGLKEINAAEIGDRVLEALLNIDQVAYVRFLSVYREFHDAREFMSVLSDLIERDTPVAANMQRGGDQESP